MDDLISRAAAIDAIRPLLYSGNCVSTLLNMPAVDAVPVIHGHWIRIHIKGKEYGKVYYQHENCAPQLFESPYHYCPHCSAKMDEQGKDVYIQDDGC